MITKANKFNLLKLFKTLGYKNVKLSSTFGELKKEPFHLYKFPIQKRYQSKIKH